MTGSQGGDDEAVRAINVIHETGCGKSGAMTTQITMVLLHGSLKTWGEFLRRAPALAKRRRMRGYDAVKPTAACSSPSLIHMRTCRGCVANTANKIEIRYNGPDLYAS